MLQECTMLICVNDNDVCVGGETIFKLNDKNEYKSSASCTPGHVLLFRKDIK